MLYTKNQKPFDPRLFADPTAEYRGTPFWAWNSKLEEKELLRQIDCFREMGFGGFHMHVRTGMATPYLGDEYMHLIRSCVDHAKATHMLAWLYDEDRWPSGAAGGIVTRNEAYRSRHLLFTPFPYDSKEKEATARDSSARTQRTGHGSLLACFDIELDADGYLASYRRISPGEPAKGTKWYAYREIAESNPWFNNQTYVDTLNPKAIQAFIKVTHERYWTVCKDEFGKTIPAIFTDEPQFAHKTLLNRVTDQMNVFMPWTDDFPETFEAAYGVNLVERLPEVFWNRRDDEHVLVRYLYHDHIAERFASAFADQVGRWCRNHQILLTGHMMEEPTLFSQTAALGEAMRSYRSFDLPGIDMLCDRREWTTAKQAQSASHQYGRPGVMSELYGVTNWDFDFRGHKLQGDWQAALGVTVRVPHLSWVSMAGEAKRDYPASINYQAPWHAKYGMIENHFARVNTVMTRGKPYCRVGVIHPVESYWLHWGPREQTQSVRDELDQHFTQLSDWLLRGQIDFDFISEALLPDLCPVPENPLPVGQMRYDVVIVPHLLMLRETTLSRLEAFQDAGGRVIFTGDCPKWISGRRDDSARGLFDKAEHVPFSAIAILDALEPVRWIDLRLSDGRRCDAYLTQVRQEGEERWIFLARADRPDNPDMPSALNLDLYVRGPWFAEQLDSLNGSMSKVNTESRGQWTLIQWKAWNHDSLLLHLVPDENSLLYSKPETQEALSEIKLSTTDKAPLSSQPEQDKTENRLLDAVPVCLDEPNVCLLDLAEYKLDDEPFRPVEEILRADNQLRGDLGWPERGRAMAQPWTVPEEQPKHSATLRFQIQSTTTLKDCALALEDARQARITWNGLSVPADVTGWYVDRSIETVALPTVKEGTNTLEITWPLGPRTNLEACYLLGDFSVSVAGTQKILGDPARTLAFSDITRQGLPFYGGNITYRMQIESKDKPVSLHVPHYRGALISVDVDGQEKDHIVFSPYTVRFDNLEPGVHTLNVKLFGNRVNTFGPVHDSNRTDYYIGPNAWRTQADAWSYEYQLKETGIIQAPDLSGARWIHPGKEK